MLGDINFAIFLYKILFSGTFSTEDLGLFSLFICLLF